MIDFIPEMNGRNPCPHLGALVRDTLRGTFPKNPEDRMLVASARDLSCPRATVDDLILGYSKGLSIDARIGLSVVVEVAALTRNIFSTFPPCLLINLKVFESVDDHDCIRCPLSVSLN